MPLQPLGAPAPDPAETFPSVRVALAQVRAHLDLGAMDVLLLGPPRVGKTAVLRQLTGNWPGRVFYCPFLHFEPEEAVRWLASVAHAPPETTAADLAAVLSAGATPSVPNLLLVDEAQTIPAETLDALVEWLQPAGASLRRVWAGLDGSALHQVPRRVDPRMARVVLARGAESEAQSALANPGIAPPTPAPRVRPVTPRVVRKGVGRERPSAGPPAAAAPDPLPARASERPPISVSSGSTPAAVAPDPSPARASEPPPVSVSSGSTPAAVAPDPSTTRALESQQLLSGSSRSARAAAAVPTPTPGSRRWLGTVAILLAAGLAMVLLTRSWLSDGDEVSAPVVPPPPVLVDVNAVPWAHILVDGEEAGATPLGGLALSPGPHTIEARFPDGARLTREVDVGSDEPRISFRR